MKILIIDGTNLLHRSYHSAEDLDMKNSNGENTGVVYLTLKSLKKLKSELKLSENDRVIFTLDNKQSKRYRLSLFDGYKGTRKSVKDDSFFKQIEIVKNILHFSNIDVIEQNGLEADDICGILAKQYSTSEKVEVVYIFSSDKDYYQILNEKIIIIRPNSGMSKSKEFAKYVNMEKYLEDYEGLTNKQFVLLKSIVGDDGDNIIGIKKLGEKTGIKIIKEYENISNWLNDENGYLSLPKWLREQIKVSIENKEIEKWHNFEIEHWLGRKIKIGDLFKLNYLLGLLNYRLDGLSIEEKEEFKIKLNGLMKKEKIPDEIQKWLDYLEINSISAIEI